MFKTFCSIYRAILQMEANCILQTLTIITFRNGTNCEWFSFCFPLNPAPFRKAKAAK